MSDHVSFMQEIAARPDDDLPRLVYADYLDENGLSERAEFIRLQVEAAKIQVPPEYTIYAPTLTVDEFDHGDNERWRQSRTTIRGELIADTPMTEDEVIDLVNTEVDYRTVKWEKSGKVYTGSGIIMSAVFLNQDTRSRTAIELTVLCLGPQRYAAERARKASLTKAADALLTHHWREWIVGLPNVPSAWNLRNRIRGPLGSNSRGVLFERGMVEQVECAVLEWHGRHCMRCSGEGCSPYAVAANGPCQMTDGIGKRSVEVYPTIRKAYAVDRRPRSMAEYAYPTYRTGFGWTHTRYNRLQIITDSEAYVLPKLVFDKLVGGGLMPLPGISDRFYRVYRTVDEANDALAVAMVEAVKGD